MLMNLIQMIYIAHHWYASDYSKDHPDDSLSVVEYLIEKGAKVNAKNKYEQRALHFASTL